MARTVQDLIDRLLTFDPDMKVVASKDAEGNDFSEWDGDISFGKSEAYNDFKITDDDDEINSICLWTY